MCVPGARLRPVRSREQSLGLQPQEYVTCKLCGLLGRQRYANLLVCSYFLSENMREGVRRNGASETQTGSSAARYHRLHGDTWVGTPLATLQAAK